MIKLTAHSTAMIILALLLVIVFPPRRSAAQYAVHRGIPLSTAEYKQFRSIQLIQNEGTAQQRSTQLSLQSVSMQMQAPIPVNGFKTILIPTLRYDSLFATADTPYPDLHIGTFEGNLGLRQAISDGWAIVQLFGFGLATDFERINTFNFFGSGSIVLTKHVRPGLSFGGGVAITNTADFPIPIFLFHWRPKPSIWISAALPRGLKLGYSPIEALEFGLGARVNRSRFVMEDPQGDTTINNTMMTAGVETHLHVGAGLHLGLNVGFTYMLMMDIEHSQPEQGKTRLAQAPWFTGLTLEYRVFPNLPAKPIITNSKSLNAP